jgi:murein L,D-transpeptidase YafK
VRASRFRILGSAALLAAAILGGCTPVVPPPVVALPVEIPPFDPEASNGLPPFLAWASDASHLLVVDKEKRVLGVYRHGIRAKTYAVVLGREPGRKLYEGDRRTPSGVYQVVKKRPHRRFHRFLDIDYPNREDLALYRASLAEGGIPRNGRAPVSPGGLLGIHGSDEEELTRVGVNWTYGCVALSNADMTELYDEVAEGTVVVIRE